MPPSFHTVVLGGGFLEAKRSKAEAAYLSISRLRMRETLVIWWLDSEAVTGAVDALGTVRDHICFK
jgi:hypothetical protein